MKLEALRQHARVTPQFDHLLRYEGALNGRTLTQLDRLQRMRKGQALEGELMEQTAAPRVAEAGVSPLGQSTPARVVGAAGPAESELRGLDERSSKNACFHHAGP